MAFIAGMDPTTGFVAPEGSRSLGLDLQSSYQNAKPFPHVVIDDFLPLPLVEACIEEFRDHDLVEKNSYNREHERLKREIKPEDMSDTLRTVFYSFNSLPFIKILENITGIRGLIPDPYFLGAGFHEISNGGHLSIHADFNQHKLMSLERRINVLIYLNRDWEDGFGGQLELWDEQMTTRISSIIPIANRCVIFNTTSQSFHGNPNPVHHPRQVTRKSIALYYYTATWTDEKKSHTTRFAVRPGSNDKADWAVRIPEIARDFMPPVAVRLLTKLRRKGSEAA